MMMMLLLLLLLWSVLGMVTMYDWSPDRNHLHVDRRGFAGASDEVNGAAHGPAVAVVCADFACQGLACPARWLLPVMRGQIGVLGFRLQTVMVDVPRQSRQQLV